MISASKPRRVPRKKYLDTIIESHFHVIEIIIKRYLSVNPRYNYLREDMISRGSEVLVLAAHKFDQERGVTFSTYFSNRMRGDIKTGLVIQRVGKTGVPALYYRIGGSTIHYFPL